MKRLFDYWGFRLLTFLIISGIGSSIVVYYSSLWKNFLPQEYSSILISFFIFLVLLFASMFLEKMRSQGQFFTFGLMLSNTTLRDIALGLSLPVFCFSLVLMNIMLSSSLPIHYEWLGTSAYLLSAIEILILAANEELLVRGVAFQAIQQRFGNCTALISTSLVFVVLHLLNPSMSFLSGLNIFLAGLLFGTMYIRTKSLWLPISFHFFWNFGEAMLLSSPISGSYGGTSFVLLNYEMLPKFWYGAAFGFEGGIICTLVLLFCLLIAIKYSNVSPYLASIFYKREYK